MEAIENKNKKSVKFSSYAQPLLEDTDDGKDFSTPRDTELKDAHDVNRIKISDMRFDLNPYNKCIPMILIF